MEDAERSYFFLLLTKFNESKKKMYNNVTAAVRLFVCMSYSASSSTTLSYLYIFRTAYIVYRYWIIISCFRKISAVRRGPTIEKCTSSTKFYTNSFRRQWNEIYVVRFVERLALRWNNLIKKNVGNRRAPFRFADNDMYNNTIFTDSHNNDDVCLNISRSRCDNKLHLFFLLSHALSV